MFDCLIYMAKQQSSREPQRDRKGDCAKACVRGSNRCHCLDKEDLTIRELAVLAPIRDGNRNKLASRRAIGYAMNMGTTLAVYATIWQRAR